MPLKRLALLTSGGDAPGMNACIRAIVRTALGHRLSVLGFRRGYQGLVCGEFEELHSRSVSNIIQRGGTVLRTARCAEFETEQGLRRAAIVLRAQRVDALLVIGGDGSLRGCRDLANYWSGQILGLPGTIDNDLYGTDYTIGFDTAVNTALDAIDKIRDTADAHERCFLVEVMGRRAGFIAAAVGLTGGAEEILLPGQPVDFRGIARRLEAGVKEGKTSSIIVVAEGAFQGGAYAVADALKRYSKDEFRVCVLGHIQRGGAPTAADRLLATKLGAFAVEAARKGKTGVMVGEVGGKPRLTKLPLTWTRQKPLAPFLQFLVRTLAA